MLGNNGNNEDRETKPPNIFFQCSKSILKSNSNKGENRSLLTNDFYHQTTI